MSIKWAKVSNITLTSPTFKNIGLHELEFYRVQYIFITHQHITESSASNNAEPFYTLYKRVKNDFGEYFFLIFSDTECLATKQYNNTSQLTWWRVCKSRFIVKVLYWLIQIITLNRWVYFNLSFWFYLPNRRDVEDFGGATDCVPRILTK